MQQIRIEGSITVEESELDRQRNRLYPGWWMYLGCKNQVSSQPFYLVVCRTEREYQLAKMAKPAFVRADIVHQADSADSKYPKTYDDAWKLSESYAVEIEEMARKQGFDLLDSPEGEEGARQLRDALFCNLIKKYGLQGYQ